MRRGSGRGAVVMYSVAALLLLPLVLTGCWVSIDDVTTDLDRPPVYFVSPPERPAYDATKFRAIQEQGYPDIRNLSTRWPLDEAFARVLTVIRRREWTIVGVEEKRHRVQVVAVLPVLRFRDDVIVEVRNPAIGTDPAVQSVIAMRSKSRLGSGDLGTNARRIRSFFRDLQAAP